MLDFLKELWATPKVHAAVLAALGAIAATVAAHYGFSL